MLSLSLSLFVALASLSACGGGGGSDNGGSTEPSASLSVQPTVGMGVKAGPNSITIGNAVEAVSFNMNPDGTLSVNGGELTLSLAVGEESLSVSSQLTWITRLDSKGYAFQLQLGGIRYEGAISHQDSWTIAQAAETDTRRDISLQLNADGSGGHYLMLALAYGPRYSLPTNSETLTATHEGIVVDIQQQGSSWVANLN